MIEIEIATWYGVIIPLAILAGIFVPMFVFNNRTTMLLKWFHTLTGVVDTQGKEIKMLRGLVEHGHKSNIELMDAIQKYCASDSENG